MVTQDSSNGDINDVLFALARSMTTQINNDIGPRVNALKSTMTSRLRDFSRINPRIFLGYKVGEDPQEFLHGVFKVLSVMGLHLRRRRS